MEQTLVAELLSMHGYKAGFILLDLLCTRRGWERRGGSYYRVLAVNEVTKNKKKTKKQKKKTAALIPGN